MNTLTLKELEQVVQIALDSFDDSPVKLSEDSNLYEEVGLDSIGAVALVVEIQRRFGVRIPDDRIGDLVLAQDVIDYVRSIQEQCSNAS